MKFNKDNYRFVEHQKKGSDSKEIIALGSYRGYIVKGYAKCDPRDDFKADVGETLAALRCNVKIAEKRLYNAMDKVNESTAAVLKAQKELERSNRYYSHAEVEFIEAKKMLDDFIEELN